MNKYENIKKMIPIVLVILLAALNIPSVTAAPTVEVNPSEPQPLDTVTFTVTIPNVDNIQQVTIRVQECGNEPNIGYICYTDEFNETLTESSADTYTGSVTLAQENAIEIKYQVNYLTTDGWTTYPEEDLVKVDLDTTSQPSDNTNGDSDDTASDTPGFELGVLFISVIFISLILYRRKR